MEYKITDTVVGTGKEVVKGALLFVQYRIDECRAFFLCGSRLAILSGGQKFLTEKELE